MFCPLTYLFATSTLIRVPFFFEPNWNAEIRPLEAALRIQEDADELLSKKNSVVYGDFLTKKVSNCAQKFRRAPLYSVFH